VSERARDRGSREQEAERDRKKRERNTSKCIGTHTAEDEAGLRRTAAGDVDDFCWVVVLLLLLLGGCTLSRSWRSYDCSRRVSGLGTILGELGGDAEAARRREDDAAKRLVEEAKEEVEEAVDKAWRCDAADPCGRGGGCDTGGGGGGT
jgi:hypothetical protein